MTGLALLLKITCLFWEGERAERRGERESQAGSTLSTFLFFFNFFIFFLFLGQRETEHERGRGRERGRHRFGNRLQAPSHQPRARRGAWTHGPRDRDLAEVGRSTDCATQAPPGSTLSMQSLTWHSMGSLSHNWEQRNHDLSWNEESTPRCPNWLQLLNFEKHSITLLSAQSLLGILFLSLPSLCPACALSLSQK